MIEQDKMIEYMLANEKARYEAFRALSVAFKHIVITILLCITLIACAYMYFVVPVEEETAVIDNGSKAVIQATVDNGSNIWQ